VEQHNKILNVIVTNTKDLEPGVSASYEFNQEGGVIGSSGATSWPLKGQNTNVYAQHCEILVRDNHFCIKDLCGETYVNGATMPLGIGKMAQIHHKDTFKVGLYQLMVTSESTDSYLHSSNQSLEQLFGQENELFDEDEELVLAPKKKTEHIDPLDLLEVDVKDREAQSLLGDHEDITTDTDDSEWLLANQKKNKTQDVTPQADSEFEMSSAIKLKKKSRFNPFSFFAKSDTDAVIENTTSSNNRVEEHNQLINTTHSEPKQPMYVNDGLGDIQKEELMMDDKTLDLLEEEFSKQERLDNDLLVTGEQNHMLSGPLFRGLGVSVVDSRQAQDVQMTSEEIGAALQAAVKGLLELHQHVDSGRYGVINKNLQPIEDNPLRLGLPYEETVKTMFSNDTGSVHLSAPSAISESLKNLKDHNDVVQVATTLALGQIVQAFSPETLMKRFERYRRSYEIPEQNQNAWAWEMYQSYYRELTSDRQQGFEKLFWEVFDQAYDRLLREKQMES
jgi:type VI secretion system protein ImpI